MAATGEYLVYAYWRVHLMPGAAHPGVLMLVSTGESNRMGNVLGAYDMYFLPEACPANIVGQYFGGLEMGKVSALCRGRYFRRGSTMRFTPTRYCGVWTGT